MFSASASHYSFMLLQRLQKLILDIGLISVKFYVVSFMIWRIETITLMTFWSPLMMYYVERLTGVVGLRHCSSHIALLVIGLSIMWTGNTITSWPLAVTIVARRHYTCHQFRQSHIRSVSLLVISASSISIHSFFSLHFSYSRVYLGLKIRAGFAIMRAVTTDLITVPTHGPFLSWNILSKTAPDSTVSDFLRCVLQAT